jgi:hypothetical protein
MLTINFDGTDYSVEQSRFEWVSTQITFDGSKDLLIGFRKPLRALYFNVVAQAISTKLSLKYYNGTTFAAVDGLIDFTFGLKQPGFVKWTPDEVNEAETTLVSEELFWYKINLLDADGTSLDTSKSITFRGINVVFADDHDLKGLYPTIENQLPDGQTTFIRFHEKARDEIITDLRKTGIVINGQMTDTATRKNLDQWDLLDIEEVRESATHSALSKIFAWKSDQVEDKWHILSKEHEAEAGASLSPLMTIDKNDDGVSDASEKVEPVLIIVGRQ